MFYRFYRWFRKVFLHLDDRSPLEISLANGLTVGRDFQMMEGCTLDPSHSFLITIGDRVTLAPRVHVIAHDASTKRELGYTRIAKVRIGSDVFIGAGSTILPGVCIGNKVIIGAGSVVARSVPDGCVAAGNPCRVIGKYEDYMAKHRAGIEGGPVFDESYQIWNVTEEKKREMCESLSCNAGYIR